MSFTSVTEELVRQWLVHVPFISVTEVLVTQWLVHVSFTSVTKILFSKILTARRLKRTQIKSVLVQKKLGKIKELWYQFFDVRHICF